MDFLLELHSLKLTYDLKIDGWKTIFLLEGAIFRGELLYSFREGIHRCHNFRVDSRPKTPGFFTTPWLSGQKNLLINYVDGSQKLTNQFRLVVYPTICIYIYIFLPHY